MNKLIYIWMTAVLVLILYGTEQKKEEYMPLTITSASFKNGEIIPVKYTCVGSDLSPELTWSGSPENTKSFALINDDPDAPMGTWVHWLVFNIPPSITKLPEGTKNAKKISPEIKLGKNDFGKNVYGGPCPPPGKFHRYFFKLYALDTLLNLPEGATKQQMEKDMHGHILDSAEIMGKFKR